MAGHYELMCCTRTLLEEISNPDMTPEDVAITYRLAINSSDKTDWKKVNAAIVTRWGKRGLESIKKMAWQK